MSHHGLLAERLDSHICQSGADGFSGVKSSIVRLRRLSSASPMANKSATSTPIAAAITAMTLVGAYGAVQARLEEPRFPAGSIRKSNRL